VWHCHKCAFDWVDRTDLQETESPALYQDYSYNQSIHDTFLGMREHYRAGLLSRIERYYSKDDIRQLTFLDVGCANGEYMATALDLGMASMTGVEIDQTAARNARQYGTVVEDVNLLQTHFDVVQIKNVLTNIPDFAGFLNDCVAHLKPTGVLFLDVLNPVGLTSTVRKIRFALKRDLPRYGILRPPHVINAFSEENIVTLLQARNLQLLCARQGYYGSNQVPYGKVTAATLPGLVGYSFRRGSMLLFDARKGC
jgi:SAM-dependent methyltransferase